MHLFLVSIHFSINIFLLPHLPSNFYKFSCLKKPQHTNHRQKLTVLHWLLVSPTMLMGTGGGPQLPLRNIPPRQRHWHRSLDKTGHLIQRGCKVDWGATTLYLNEKEDTTDKIYCLPTTPSRCCVSKCHVCNSPRQTSLWHRRQCPRRQVQVAAPTCPVFATVCYG